MIEYYVIFCMKRLWLNNLKTIPSPVVITLGSAKKDY
jgi:hypothetical protein